MFGLSYDTWHGSTACPYSIGCWLWLLVGFVGVGPRMFSHIGYDSKEKTNEFVYCQDYCSILLVTSVYSKHQ